MAELDVDLIPDFDELENRLDDEELTKEVNVDGGGGAGGGGGGGDGGLLATLGLEAGTDIASGAGKGGALGKIAGGLTSTVALLGGIIGFLALLEPIQQILSFLLRQVELFIIPVVTALRPVLELIQRFVVAAVRFFRNPGDFLSNIFTAIRRALASIVNSVIRTINSTIPGANFETVSTGQQGTIRDTGISRTSGTTAGGPDTVSRVDLVRDTVQAVASTDVVRNFLISDDANKEAIKRRIETLGGSRRN